MTPTFRVIDKHTGREYSEENINTDGLMEMDLDQMFLGEDGTLVMADDCDRIAYQDSERFDVLIDGYVSIDRILEIIDDIEQDRLVYSRMNEFEVLDEVKIRIAALKGGDVEVRE